MIKKLTAKTQELNPKLPQYSSSFSRCVVIKPETTELLLKKGTVYTLFEISGDSNFDTELICKVINDVIHDSYYQSEGISPIQSMEKSVVEMKEKVLQLSNDTLTSDPQGIKLNILSVVLWGNVLYVVQFGSAKSFLMKDGSINPLEMISEGNFSTASKVVDEDEVLILCTESFEKTFPPEKLLSSSISENDLDSNQACLLMRLLVDTSFSKDEEIDFGLGNMASKSETRERTERVVEKLNSAKRKVVQIIKRISASIPKRKVTLLKRKVTQISGGGKGKTKGWLFLTIIAVLLAVSVFFTFKSAVFKNDKGKEETTEQVVEEKKVEDTKDTNIEDKSKDEQYKIKRVSPEVFYDLKITDESSDPSEIQVVGEKIVVVDRAPGRIYVSNISTPNFSMETNTFPGIRSLAQTDDLLSFNDNEGYKTYNVEISQVKSSYKVEGLNLTFPYAGFIYSLSDDILTKSTEKDGALEGVVWAQNPDFNNARSMAIAYSIYILKEDGNLVNYAGGAKTDFSITGLEKPLTEPTKVIADVNLKNIYIADKGNKSIVVLDEGGALLRQYKNDDANGWADIRGLAVSSDEKVIFVLDSSKIYKINAEN